MAPALVLNANISDGLEPTEYRRWYETPLGAQVDADEKQIVFGLAELERGERVLDIGCRGGNGNRSCHACLP